MRLRILWLLVLRTALVLAAAPLASAELLILQTSPSQGRVGPAAGPFTFTFSAPVRPEHLSLSGALRNVRLSPATGVDDLPVDFGYTLDESGTVLSLRPSVPLREGQTYVLTLACDPDPLALRQQNARRTPLAGGQPLNPLVFTVTDDSPPGLTARRPESDETGVSVHLSVLLSFDEPVDPASLAVTTVPPVAWRRVWAADRRWLCLEHPDGPLSPETTYEIAVSAADFAGNPIAEVGGLSWRFRTGPPTPPDRDPPRVAAVYPPPDATKVPVGTQPWLEFSEPIDPASLRVALEQADTADPVPLDGVTAEGVGARFTLRPSHLDAGPTCYRLRVLAASDLAGNPLDASALPSGGWLFTTEDLTPPRLAWRSPEHGSDLEPEGPGRFVLRFSEPLAAAAGVGPYLEATYLEGGSPAFTPESASPVSAGLWRLDRAGSDGSPGWDAARKTVTLLTAAPPDAPDGPHLRPGCTLVLRLIQARDPAGNDLDESLLPATWSVKVVDTARPRLLRASPSGGRLAPPDAPITLTFSKPMHRALRFESPGDFAGFADPVNSVLVDGIVIPVANRWVTKSFAWSEDRRTLVLHHAPFPVGDLPTEHALHIVDAKDADLRPLEGLLPTDGQPLQDLRWRDAGQPHVLRWQYQAPRDPRGDQSSFGLLYQTEAGPDPAADRFFWADPPPPPQVPTVPRNARLRVWFSQEMDRSRAADTVYGPGGERWSQRWSADGLVLELEPAAPLSVAAGQPLAREIRLAGAQDEKGDAMVPATLSFAVLPAVAVPGDADGDWSVDAQDLGLALRFFLRLARPSGDQLRAVDLRPCCADGTRGDGVLAVEDLVSCLRAYLGVGENCP